MSVILDSEIKLRKAATNGRMTAANPPVVTGTADAVHPRITRAARVSGSEVAEKLFWHLAHAGTVAAHDCRAYLTRTSAGPGTRFVLIAGTQRNTVASLTGSERRYGVGALAVNVSASGTELVVQCEPGSGADEIFQDGDIIWIGNGTNEEFAVIDGDPVWDEDEATLTLAAGLTYAYTTTGPTYVAACITAATVVASADNLAETGGFDFNAGGAFPIELDGLGTIEQTWTLTFTGASTFGVVGDTVGSVGAGSTGTDFAPVNPANSAIYFRLRAAAWSGTPATGNTLVFQTHPATVPFFALRILDEGAEAASGDGTTYGFAAES